VVGLGTPVQAAAPTAVHTSISKAWREKEDRAAGELNLLPFCINTTYIVLQRDFTFPTELNVAYDERDKLPRGDVGNN
jgi:hypothetical protein